MVKNHEKIKYYFFLVCLFFFSIGNEIVKGQDRIELGGFVGSSYYLGDFNPDTPFKNPGLAFGGIARYVLNDRIALKGMALYGRISGNYKGADVTFVETGAGDYQFKRNVGDVSAQVEFNFLSYDHKFISTTTFTPYISVGLASTIFSRIDAGSEKSAGKPSFILSLPFGVGAKYKINKWIRIGAEWTFRKTFADDLDYMGDGVVDPSDPYNFSENVGTHNNDWVSFAGVYVTVSMLKRKTRCNDGTK